MEKPGVVTIDTFPKCPINNRIILYYMIRSTRVTVVSCGKKQLLLYADEKTIKLFKFPGNITCVTLINAVSAREQKSDSKVLLCGSAGGSVFALTLPADKESLKAMRKKEENSKSGKCFVTVYSYIGLSITYISCINGHLVILGIDEDGIMQMLLLQPNFLNDSLSVLNLKDHAGSIVIPPCEIVPISPPVFCNELTGFVIFLGNDIYSSPYYTSLENIQRLDHELYMTLFGTETSGVSTPVLCFLYSNGDIWCSFGLSPGSSKQNQYFKLVSMQEKCTAVATVLITSEFFENHIGRQAPYSGAKMGLLLLGADRGCSILHESCESSGKSKKFGVTHIPYPSEVKSFDSKWGNLIETCGIFLHSFREHLPSISINSSSTNFFSEQQVDVKSERVWSFGSDHNQNMALQSISLSELWAMHTFDSPGKSNLQALMLELEQLNTEFGDLKSKSIAISNLLECLGGAISALLKSENHIFQFTMKGSILKLSDANKLLLSVETTKTFNHSILKPFLYNILISVKWGRSVTGITHTFTLSDEVSKEELNIILEKEDFCLSTVGNVNVFLNIFNLADAKCLPDNTVKIVLSQLPVLLHLHHESVTINDGKM